MKKMLTQPLVALMTTVAVAVKLASAMRRAMKVKKMMMMQVFQLLIKLQVMQQRHLHSCKLDCHTFMFNVLWTNRGSTERIQQKVLNVQGIRQ